MGCSGQRRVAQHSGGDAVNTATSSVSAPPPFNWRTPDYAAIYQERGAQLARIRANPESALPRMFAYYRAKPWMMISDFGVTHDPRLIERGLPAQIPFVLFPAQVDWCRFVMERWRAGENGLTEKSRDMGISWLAMSLSVVLCTLHKGLTIGIGSRKEQLLDNGADPNSLFHKARMFHEHLPAEFRARMLSAHMRLVFPETGCSIIGEAGDNIGRGGRTSIYFVDEAAYLERPELIEASLSATTNCRQDISSVNGLNNPFAQKRFSGKVPVFTAHWTKDPRKSAAWYAKQSATLDPVTVAQEIDISYHASVEGQFIPPAWVNAAIGAHLKLGLPPTGMKFAALDVADEGRDLCAFAARHGVVLTALKSWSGKGGDIFKTVVKAFSLCDELGHESLFFDSDGLGAGARGDANVINAQRESAGLPRIHDQPFRGSAAVVKPESEMVPKRKNKDFFLNAKSQAWWALRIRFQQTFRAVVERMPVDPEAIISLSPDLPELLQLQSELSQIAYSINATGKVVIEKAPDGMRSPNLADALMIAFNPTTHALELWKKLAS
jgi:phage terminase large subunit